MGKLAVLAIALCIVACSKGEDVDEYNKKQAALADSKKPKGNAPVKVKTALPGGTTLGCTEIIDATKLTELMEEKDLVTILDKTKEEFGSTSACSVRRGGEVMDAKAQEEQVKKSARLGVLAGDELCHITVHCSLPAEDELFQQECQKRIEKGDRRSNEDIGTYACIKTTPKGPHDAFTYEFIDPDTRCIMSVRGGPSVNEESDVQKCAQAVSDLLGMDQIKPKTE